MEQTYEGTTNQPYTPDQGDGIYGYGERPGEYLAAYIIIGAYVILMAFLKEIATW